MDLAEIYGIEVNDIFRFIDLTGVLLTGLSDLIAKFTGGKK